MAWTIEVWVTKRRAWQVLGDVDSFEEAREAVLRIVGDHQAPARAHNKGAPYNEIRGMRASVRCGFCCWTGSGGAWSTET